MFPSKHEILTMPKLMLPFHDHPLSCTTTEYMDCDRCIDEFESGIIYHCMECDFSLHKECLERIPNHPFQCNHFLKIVEPDRLPANANSHCHFCRRKLYIVFAHCTICNISMDLNCVKNPPPLTIFQPKHHKHTLTLLLRMVTFTCNACGVEGDRDPYVCLECNLMLHKNCIDLPRVISINRHDHRISHTFHLGQGDWECGVCRKKIDWVYGAFICSCCPSYAVHSKCATRKEVWDGRELEDVPEEEEEIEDPFKVINEKDIIHFSHEQHVLRLDENHGVNNDNMRCGGCVLPINNDPCYKCVKCDFSLHKVCATLPRKKRHMLHNHKLILRVGDYISYCVACQTYFNGFRYECKDISTKCHFEYDVRCSSLSEPFHHYLHPHPLYWTLEGSKRCQACDREVGDPLSCTVCEYALCMRCANLPRKVKHRCDDHFLSLCHDAGNSSGDLWCDICETKTDPSVCYYTCDECGISLHINCVLGDLYYLKVGDINGDDAEVILPNNGVTRPVCDLCEERCKFPFLIKKTTEEEVIYTCSFACTFVS